MERSERDFAAEVRAVFDAHLLKTIATLRRDGAPRLSGLTWRPGQPLERAFAD